MDCAWNPHLMTCTSQLPACPGLLLVPMTLPAKSLLIQDTAPHHVTSSSVSINYVKAIYNPA